MNPTFRQGFIGTLCAAGILCSLSFSQTCMGASGQLLDQDGLPVPDAWVVAKREECLGGFNPGGCPSTCVEIKVAKTDSRGNYSFRSWHSFELHAYREGYAESYRSSGAGKLELFMKRGGRDPLFDKLDPVSGRIFWLAKTALGMYCSHAPREQRDAVIPVLKAMFQEADSIARTPEQHREAKKICDEMYDTAQVYPQQPPQVPKEEYLRSVAPACNAPIYDSRDQEILAAVRSKNPGPIRRAAQEGFDFNRLLDGNDPPIIIAALNGSAEMVTELAAAGAKADAVGKEGRTALEQIGSGGFRQSEEKRRAVIKALLEAGADPNRPSISGYPPLIRFAEQANPNLSNRPEINPSKLHTDRQIFALLLQHGARIDQTVSCETCSDRWKTVLHVAHDPEIARMAIEHGANVNAKARKGDTPLMIFRLFPDVTRILLEHGADPNLADDAGWTPLMNVLQSYESEREHRNKLWLPPLRETAEMLVAAGARLDARNQQGFDVFFFTKDEAFKQRLRAIAASRKQNTPKQGN